MLLAAPVTDSVAPGSRTDRATAPKAPLTTDNAIPAEDRQRILLAAIALSVVRGALGAIPAVGMYISSVMGSLGNLYAAASITVILVALYEKLKP